MKDSLQVSLFLNTYLKLNYHRTDIQQLSFFLSPLLPTHKKHLIYFCIYIYILTYLLFPLLFLIISSTSAIQHNIPGQVSFSPSFLSCFPCIIIHEYNTKYPILPALCWIKLCLVKDNCQWMFFFCGKYSIICSWVEKLIPVYEGSLLP